MATKKTSSNAPAASTAVTVVPAPALPPVAEAVPIAMAESSRATRSATPAPLQHMQSFQILLGQWAARGSSNAVTSAALLPQGLNTGIWQELAQMQAAVLRRLQLQQQAWLKGCASLAEEYQQGKRANTMSKLIEQQCNLVAQFGQLLGKQATDLIGLQENIEVDYGYWASRKLGQ